MFAAEKSDQFSSAVDMDVIFRGDWVGQQFFWRN